MMRNGESFVPNVFLIHKEKLLLQMYKLESVNKC